MEIVVRHQYTASIECPRCQVLRTYALLDPVKHPAPMPGEAWECGHCGHAGIIDREEVV